MRMHPGMMIAAASLGMMASPVAASAAAHKQEALPAAPEVKAVPTKRQLRRAYGITPDYRAKGPQAKRRKRPNRLHISKRVRRAHRRAKQGKR